MVILNRKHKEAILLLPQDYPGEGSPCLSKVFAHGPINVHTMGVHRSSVHLGIKAPWALKVVRHEILDYGQLAPLSNIRENSFLIFKRMAGQSFDLIPEDDADLERTTLEDFFGRQRDRDLCAQDQSGRGKLRDLGATIG